MSCLPGFELKASSVSETVSLGEWTHERRGRAGGTKLERSAAWQLRAEEPAVRSEAAGQQAVRCEGCTETRTPSALLGRGETGPFGRGTKSVLGIASDV